MARILTQNRYELAAGRYDRLSRSITPNSILLNKALNDMDKFKTLQDRNIVLGGMHRIRYKFHKHDPEPLVIFLNEVKTNIDVVPGVNLHYLIKREANLVVKLIKFFNSPRLARGQAPALIWEMVNKFPLRYLPYRLYKIPGIRPIEYIPVLSWELTALTETSRWQGFRDF